MKTLLSLLVALVLAPVQASSSEWAEGAASIGYFAGDDTSEVFNFVDFTARYQRLRWGIEAGAFGVAGGRHETYAAATYQASFGKFSLGNPRPAYDDVATSVLTEMLPILALDRIGTDRSRATHGTINLPDFLPLGGRYSASGRGFEYALSLHGVPEYTDLIAGGALRGSRGDWTFEAALEASRQDIGLRWNAKARIERVIGSTVLGLGLFAPRANDQAVAAEIFARVPASDRTEITGLVRLEDRASSGVGVGLAYRLTPRLHLQTALFGQDRERLSAGTRLEFRF